MATITSSLQPRQTDSTRTVVIAGAIIAALYFGSEILVPIALAILLSFVLAPTVRFLHKIGLGRIVPVAATVLLAVVILGGLGFLIASQVRELTADLPRYEATIVRKIEVVEGMSKSGVMARVQEAIGKLNKAIDRSPQPAAQPAGGPHADAVNAPGPNAAPADPTGSPMPVQVVSPPPGPIDTMLRVAAPLIHPLATAGIVLIFVVFILLQREDLRNRAIRLFGASDLQRTTAAINDGAKRLSRYLLTQCAVNAGAGLVVGTSLWAIGLPSPILLGVLFACLRFVPYIGPIIGAVLPVALAAAVDPGWSMVVWAVGVLLVVELLIGQVVEPFAYGHNTGLSPIAVVIAATFWTVLWGPVGLLLSTPLTVCLVVLGRHVEHLEFLDVLLGDRPPLTPAETFYQRMLANDPIEASDQAHKCLSQMSIADYYDTVALPGLLLAQDDVAQDRLDLARQTQIRDAAFEVIEDLESEHAETEEGKPAHPHFWQLGKDKADEPKTATLPDDLVPEVFPDKYKLPGSVLSIGSRGPLDDAAAAMLARVFQTHGIGARAESYAALSKAEIVHLDVSGVSLICLSALDGSSPAFLRFILRRLRRKAPNAQVLVGTWWRRQGLRESDAEIDEAVKDPKASTFVDAVRFCFATSPGSEAAPSGTTGSAPDPSGSRHAPVRAAAPAVS